MPKKRFSDEQIAFALRQAEAGTTMGSISATSDSDGRSPLAMPSPDYGHTQSRSNPLGLAGRNPITHS